MVLVVAEALAAEGVGAISAKRRGKRMTASRGACDRPRESVEREEARVRLPARRPSIGSHMTPAAESRGRGAAARARATPTIAARPPSGRARARRPSGRTGMQNCRSSCVRQGARRRGSSSPLPRRRGRAAGSDIVTSGFGSRSGRLRAGQPVLVDPVHPHDGEPHGRLRRLGERDGQVGEYRRDARRRRVDSHKIRAEDAVTFDAGETAVRGRASRRRRRASGRRAAAAVDSTRRAGDAALPRDAR